MFLVISNDKKILAETKRMKVKQKIMAYVNEYVSSEVLPNDDGAGGECLTSETQWRNSKQTEISVIGVRTDQFDPISSISNTKTYQFELYSSLNELLDVKTVKLFLMYKIVDTQGNDLQPLTTGPNNDINPITKVVPVCGMATAMFKSCEIKINDITITPGDALYAFKSDMQKRLTIPEPSRKEQGSLEGFVQEYHAWDDLPDADKEEIFEATAPSSDPIKGPFIRRFLDTKGSKQKQLISDITADITSQSEFLAPNTKMTVILSRQDDDSFCYLTKSDSNHDYKIKVISAHIECEMKIMDTDFITYKMEELKKDPYRAAYKNIQMQEFFFSSGLMDLSKPILFHLNSVSPDRFFCVLLDQVAKNGQKDKDPFNYTDKVMSSFEHVRSDGRTRHRPVHLRRWGAPGYNNPDVCEVVHNLYKAVNLSTNGEDTLGIDMYNILRRNFFMGFNLQKNEGATCGAIYDLPDRQNNGIKIHLKRALTHACVMLVYAEYNTEILIDSYGNVTLRANALA